jgi:hypothetical protein
MMHSPENKSCGRKKLWKVFFLSFFEFIIATTGIDTTLGGAHYYQSSSATVDSFFIHQCAVKLCGYSIVWSTFSFEEVIKRSAKRRSFDGSRQKEFQQRRSSSKLALIKYLNSICLVKQKGISYWLLSLSRSVSCRSSRVEYDELCTSL